MEEVKDQIEIADCETKLLTVSDEKVYSFLAEVPVDSTDTKIFRDAGFRLSCTISDDETTYLRFVNLKWSDD